MDEKRSGRARPRLRSCRRHPALTIPHRGESEGEIRVQAARETGSRRYSRDYASSSSRGMSDLLYAESVRIVS